MCPPFHSKLILMHTRSRSLIIVLLAGLTVSILSGCAESDPGDPIPAERPAPGLNPSLQAVAGITPTEGYGVSGQITFNQEEEGVRIIADLQGLTPGAHGFHIHERGDCSDNAAAAGGHFNPMGSPHGRPSDPPDQRHLGDLGNLEAGDEGHAVYNRLDTLISLEEPDAVVGKAVIIHRGEDTFAQPSGAAGPRVGCGIIKMVHHPADSTSAG